MMTDASVLSGLRLGRTIGPADVRHQGNIFNILRLLFASSVIFSHAYELTGNPDPSDAVLPFSVSRFAVLLFFTLSGFLVTNSLEMRGVLQFAQARALRMLPGLWVMLVVTAVIATIGFGTLPLAAMPGNASLWQYLLRNAFLLGHYYSIDGVFVANPIPTAINGSLWTIPREVHCYIALAIIGATGLLARRHLLLVGYGLGIAAHMLLPLDIIPQLAPLRPLAISFFAGVLLYLYRERVFLSWPLAVLVVLLAMAAEAGPWRELAAQLSAAYVALVAAILVPGTWKRFSHALPDYSFGIYIYAFPVQQAMIATGIGATPFANMASTLVFTVPLAALSWHLIEKPALALKGRGRRNATLPA
ncbi:MAG: acyltransferase family protein [Polymorphobacter sp.]